LLGHVGGSNDHKRSVGEELSKVVDLTSETGAEASGTLIIFQVRDRIAPELQKEECGGVVLHLAGELGAIKLFEKGTAAPAQGDVVYPDAAHAPQAYCTHLRWPPLELNPQLALRRWKREPYSLFDGISPQHGDPDERRV
jgi:hypothetical protein